MVLVLALAFGQENLVLLFGQEELVLLVGQEEPVLLVGQEKLAANLDGPTGHQIHFTEIPVVELIRFVSKISKVNFIFDHRELQFTVSFSSGKPVPPEEVITALVQILRVHGFGVSEQDDYYMIHPLGKEETASSPELVSEPSRAELSLQKLQSDRQSALLEFAVYKLKYHQGQEIEEALKKIASDLKGRSDRQQGLIEAIQTIQWVKGTNSLLYSGDAQAVESLQKLIKTLDVPLRQVFIEVLVVETDSKKTLDFGLQWIGGGQFKNRVGFGTGSSSGNSDFTSSVQGINGTNTPTGPMQIPFSRGFDLGVIGDLILHKGKSYLTLGALVSALQADGDSTIVLNQKIITQDNKNSTIFVGDNIPFTGSIVQTIGQSQQTTANVEYRDIGVNLSITPMLGEEDIITLDIDQEITEAVEDSPSSSKNAEGIRTTKTNMATHVHVPDNHFLVLSGMVRNARSLQKAGIPCLGGLPAIGVAFSKTRQIREKRNVIVFVRPHIINSFEDYSDLSKKTEGAELIEEEIGK